MFKNTLLGLIVLLFILMTLPSVLSTCPVTYDKEIYHKGETIVASMSCDTAGEKNKD